MSRGLSMAALVLLVVVVIPGNAQQRAPFGSLNQNDLKFQVVDTRSAIARMDTAKFFRPQKQQAPFSLSKFLPKFSLPLISSKPGPTTIAKPGQNPLLPANGPVVFNPTTTK